MAGCLACTLYFQRPSQPPFLWAVGGEEESTVAPNTVHDVGGVGGVSGEW